ncbi:pyridoxal-phosphate dependent enzyme [Alteromonas aestuariivivens]|uniref:Cysteine synthase B n=1 Tax=Alteromonas aestuariivivens TaxID=1938339 RepID=A0A3D8MCR2_9ALTE|nr:pyridoxal-phosphate dependent enzyme [Alteromonas aestuariivivens]RDV28202.1 pyridoxal-phosphate dependent enzyme [Alteromonas aestuariivivens]
MGVRYNSILETVGHTPVVRINNLGPKEVNLFVKMESFNPMGSVKDRLALGVIEDAERKGELAPGQTIVEATSGNTGIGLAMVCAQKGYPLVVVMAENFSVERRRLMRFLGARVVLTPAALKGTGMVAKAKELAEAHGWWQSRQFENPANAEIHARTTAVEILDDFSDIQLDYWVTGFGTAGTLSGVSRVLKQASPETQIIVCEPDNSAILASGIPQPENASHPSFRPHLMQGWSPDFIPKLARTIPAGCIDAYIGIDGNQALQCARDLARKEGMFVGVSSGATFAGALKIAEVAPAGSNILCMLPDTGERYLSTPLFDDVSESMSDDELAISRSTPGYRFDVPTGAPLQTAALAESDPAAEAKLTTLIDGSSEQIVMFALEWCEFCWSVRKVLNAYGIPYQSVDLDSVAYQQDNLGGRIRNVLNQQTQCVTLPQIFLAGEFLGGCTDLFDAIKDDSFLPKLKKLGIGFDESVTLNPYDKLPKWLHPR